MKKVSSFLFIIGLLLFSSMLSVPTEAATDNVKKTEKVEKVRNYIKKNISKISPLLEELKDKENLTLEDVENTIEEYYKNNPAPEEVVNDKSLSIEDVFPKKIKQIKKENQNEKVFNVNEFIKEKESEKAEGINNDDHLIRLKHNSGEIYVYVSSTGDILVMENRETKSNVQNKLDNESNRVSIQALPWEYTSTKRTTGIAYNALGQKMFTLWAEGSFKYNGSDVQVATADGDYTRHFWGSTLEIQVRNLGSSRYVYVENEKYAEVYSRLYYESTFGIRWAGITMSSATVEAYVGGSKYGNTYGSVSSW